MQTTFEKQVKNIMAMRLANPQHNLPTDYLSCARELSEYTCKRLNNHPRYCIQVGGNDPKKALSPYPGSQKGAVGGVADADPAALIEWLGAGGNPVMQDRAEYRALVCSKCPENSSSPACDPGRRLDWRSWVTAPVAKMLKGYLQIRNRMRLSTTHDKVLGKCLACHCELKLKVFTPIDHISDNMHTDTMAKLHPDCWVLKEMANGTGV